VTGVSPRTHGVVSNHILNRATTRVEDFTGDPIYDAADLVRAPTFYDRAHAAGLRTAAIDWPATRHAASLDFSLPFFKNQQIFETHTAPAVWKELRALGYPVERQGEWAELPRRFLKDAMVAARAEARFVMNLGAGWVYALGGGDRERLARDLRGELAALEGVAAVWTPQEYASLGLPGPAENDRVGDLLLEAAPGYMLADETR